MKVTVKTNYRPQRSSGKVMFLHVSVILFTGGLVSQHALQVVSQHVLQISGGWGWYPSMPCRWYPRMPCMSPGGYPGPPQEGGVSLRPLGAVHAGRYSQQAGGTHPTGMHSCSQKLPSNLHIIIPDMPGHGNTDRVELEDDIYPLLIRKLHQVLQKDQVYIFDKGRKLHLFIICF